MKLSNIWLVSGVKNYFSNATIHGLKFIAEDNRHWAERLLWVLLCMVSWYGSALLIIASWDAFQSNAISFVVETTYLEANTSFPSISVCEEDNMLRVYEVTQTMFGDNHDCNLDEVIKEITYFRGTAYYIKEFCFSEDIQCPKDGYTNIAEMVRSPCEQMFISCKWKGEPFDCCKHFKKTPTELGTCFTLSSKYENPEDPDYIFTSSNRWSGVANLYIELNASAKVYMHPDADIPFYNTMTTDILSPGINSYKKFTISVTDIENEPEIRQLSVAQRKCRFADENNLEVSDEYSYSACVTDCRRKEQLRVCNCTSHLMPKTEPRERCNMSGINCLNNHYSDLSVQKTSWSRKEGLICDCLPGCHEAEYNVVTVSGYEIAENQSNIEIMLDRLPTERFKRTVVRGRLDLVVSMGGTAGLFVGASLLSLVEIFYFLLFRRRDSLQDGSGDPGARDPEGPTVPARAVPSLQPRFYQPPSPSKLTRQYPTTHRSVAYFNP